MSFQRKLESRDLDMNAAETIQKFLEAENKRDWETWASFLDERVSYEVIGSETRVAGRAAYTKKMKETYAEIPDWQFDIVHLYGDDQAVIVELAGEGHFTGTHQNRFIRGAELHLPSVCVFEMRNEKIFKIREYFDAIGYQRQLNVAT